MAIFPRDLKLLTAPQLNTVLQVMQPDCQLHDYCFPNTLQYGDDGLSDWQLLCRGNQAHDVSYVISTGLSIAMRRQYERELLRYYCALMPVTCYCTRGLWSLDAQCCTAPLSRQTTESRSR
jgi:hypothetical protein